MSQETLTIQPELIPVDKPKREIQCVCACCTIHGCQDIYSISHNDRGCLPHHTDRQHGRLCGSNSTCHDP